MMNAALFLMGSPDQAGWINLVFLGAIFLIFYFFIIRPQSQRQKKIQEMVDNLEKGDKIVTSGGMIAQVKTVDEDTVLAEIDSGVKARFKKSSITDVNPNQND
ncbi:preprotein translocase subunit YajC [Fodinibius salsisoli]|uniref:Sec translocon accessory complex subunit YajC n=1 Tax=Fodinibius salsisoli TaxID=2820877 RepID=A0ABT3PS86_9BACT|nr:preprotein translocase subunit YajC [Fodinibius salsisoli]MCW9708711.1 preprotein translocase subunit YajC [Fodinibius salsisoli]